VPEAATGNLSDSLIVTHDGKPNQLRVPYALGFYMKGLDRRIDDPGISAGNKRNICNASRSTLA